MAEKWITVAPGIRCRENAERLFHGKPDRYFTLRFKIAGKEHHERLGWASDGWNLTKAKTELAKLKTAAATGEGAVTLQEKREEAQRKRDAELVAPTLQRVWEEYKKTIHGNVLRHFEGNVKNHLAAVMPMRVEDLRTHHIESLAQELQEQGLSPQTVRHQLALIRQIVFWGAKHGFNEHPPLHKLCFTMPKIDNRVTENLTDEQLATFLQALDNYPDQRLAASMRFALYTGVRRYAIFHLEWQDVDFHRKQICLRGEHAKNGRTEFIPLTPIVEELLKSLLPADGPLVFGEVNFMSRAIKHLSAYVKPFLPAGFRPYHGLRHTYASRLASSGVSLFELQKLLTHDNASMTQRYAHLANDSLRQAASIMGDVVKRAVNETAQQEDVRRPETVIRRARVRAFQGL
ncbi:MAG: site-specific integrase [Desulfovibrio sp.]|nr:site-specific integrase [Desulfovibrio sp.]